MTLATTSPRLPLTGAALVTLNRAPLRKSSGLFGRAAGFVAQLLVLVAIVWSIPFVILAIGLPVVLGVRLLLWVGGMLGGS